MGILIELDEMIDTSEYSAYQRRYLGWVGELLLDVRLAHQGYSFREVPMVMIGRVQWGRKIFAFLVAKILGRGIQRVFEQICEKGGRSGCNDFAKRLNFVR